MHGMGYRLISCVENVFSFLCRVSLRVGAAKRIWLTIIRIYASCACGVSRFDMSPVNQTYNEGAGTRQDTNELSEDIALCLEPSVSSFSRPLTPHGRAIDGPVQSASGVLQSRSRSAYRPL